MIDLYKPCPRCGNASEKETLEFIADQYSYKSIEKHHSRGRTHEKNIQSSTKIDKAKALEPVPPNKPTDSTGIFVFITFFFVLLIVWQLLNPTQAQALLVFSLLGILFFFVSLFSYFFTRRSKEKYHLKAIEFQEDYVIWQRKLYCHKCGNIFDPAV